MMFEAIFDALIDWALPFAPRPILIGCTLLMLAILLALLAWAAWAYFQ